MRKLTALGLVLIFLNSCASVSQYRIEDSLQDIGLPSDKASCVGDQLRERLNSRDMQELADFLTSLSRADDATDGLDVVLEIENPAVVGAVTASAISCAFAPTGR